MPRTIRRIRVGAGFRFEDTTGQPIPPERLTQLKQLAIPPAWERVRIARGARERIQVTGRDERGRKQYLYHESFRERRNQAKFARLEQFGHALPRMRRRVHQDLRREHLCRERVLAAVVRLLDLTGARLGHDDYVRENGTYGLATLQDEHVTLTEKGLRLSYPGKNRQQLEFEIDSEHLVHVIDQARRVPGPRLFQYVDEDDQRRLVTARDVNAYIGRISGQALTSKDFRTWNASVRCYALLTAEQPLRSENARRRALNNAARAVAAELQNTLNVCKKNYIHHEVQSLYLRSRLPTVQAHHVPRGLTRDEANFLAFLATRKRRRPGMIPRSRRTHPFQTRQRRPRQDRIAVLTGAPFGIGNGV